MGKRKQGAPQKVDGRLRKELTWNMLDRNTEDEPLNILQDNDPELLDELQNIADIHLPKKQQKLTENDPKQLQSRPSTSDFSLSYNKDDLVDIFNLYVKKSSCKFNLYKDLTIRKGSHSFELAKFDISLLPFPLFFPLPSDGWSEVESFVVHISEEEDKHVISYGAGENRTKVVKNSAKKFNKNNAEKNVKFWLFCTQIPKEVLQSLKCKSLHVSVDSVDIEHSCMTIKVSGTEDFQNQTRYPSDPVRPRLMNESLKVLMDHFYSVAAPCYDILPFTKKHDIDALFKVIKDNHERCPLQHLPDVQHKDLLPRLRPYQQQAITWMVNQELRAKNLTSSGGLHILYTPVETQDGQVLYYNRYAGVLVRNYPEQVLPTAGGILGDEMGLGKTVEVLGCMLHHPREHVPQPAPLPVVEDNEVEDVTDKKKKKKKRKKKRIVPMESEGSDSDETVIYMDLDTDISSLNLTEKDIDKNKENKVEIDQASNQSSGRYESCDSGILQTAVEDQSNVPNISGDSPTLEDSKHGVSLKSGKQKNNVKSGLEQTDKQNVKKSTEPKERKSCSSRIEKPDNDDMKNEPKHHHKNIFTEQPAYHKSKFECVCGAHRFQSGKKWQRLHPVQCMVCRLWQHAECVKYDVKDPLRGEFKCPHCHAAGEPIPSGATLIISPASIAHQWVDEIMKHVAQKAISVMMYEGVGMSKQQYVQPRTLARQDIVITTYETLRKELDYVDLPHSNSADGRKLRHPKRFMAIPSPLTAVQWWRTAMMALRLSGVNRWCVTGTPIQKGLEDLVGLFLFLGVEPYYHLQWWHQLLYDPYCHGVMEPMHNLLTSVLWRTVKKDVLDQIDIPEQRQEVTWLNFSPVEEHFYRRQHQVSARLSMQTLSKWSDSSVKLSSLDRKTVSQMLFPLVRLRQACCHPQVVRGEFLPLKKDVMTMDELLESLTKKAKLEAEEAHRQLVAAMNGQAGLHIIQDEYGDAVEKYREVLRSVEEHRDMLKTDGLQQLHAMYNLHEILQAKPAGVDPTLRDHLLEKQIKELKEHYLAKAVAYLTSTSEALAPARVEVLQMKRELGEGELWYLEVIQWATDHLSQDQLDGLLMKVEDDVKKDKSHFDRNQRERPKSFLERHLHSLRALQYAMHTSMSEMKDAYKELNAAMTTLKGDPSQDLINKTVECCLRPIAEVLNNCPFCKTREAFESYESRLFAFIEKDTVRLGPDVGGFKANREGTWADSDAEKALKSILSFAKSYGVSGELVEYGTSHLKYLESLKKEYKKLRANWAGKKEHVATFDELDMCTTRLRLRLPDEPEPEIPQPNVLDRTELAQHGMKLMSDRIMANGELRRKLGQLIYLTNLAKNHVNIQDGSNPEPCPICQQELGKNWSVMQCGHCFCMDCMRILQERASFGRQNFCVKCAICRQSTHQTEISYVVTSQKYEHDELKVKGSHSTKVEAVVKCLLKIRKEDPTAKSLVFSTWVDVLSVIAKALGENDLNYRALYASGKFQYNLSAFKENPEDTILLLPVHSGANGLNLIEATHVILVEPVLNPAQELQAIGRVHRIGQTRPTYVHRFFVKNTIEQKMYTLLKSIDVTPSMGKASEEMSLTIGDISALFSQQMEAVDREGVASPQTDDSGGLGEDTGQGSSQDIGQWLGQDADQGSSQDIGQGLGEDRGQGSSQDIDQGLEEETGRDIGQGLGEYTGQGSSQDIGQGLEADKGQESSHDKGQSLG
ncbi:E3 ubiquitin-protein ligase SHPRH-like isoform X2 [Mya arenaria]|uniref:E3 ubiquitin-protein ligase SHPRH-like isoform X2 n=1 Tax=Mya arenaria TaxID=6604 RepID=UPI0022E4E8A6|nr:E3 ubiquitin-protein ligase SHPRH-like isoform X2 [Mya arenaria]